MKYSESVSKYCLKNEIKPEYRISTRTGHPAEKNICCCLIIEDKNYIGEWSETKEDAVETACQHFHNSNIVDKKEVIEAIKIFCPFVTTSIETYIYPIFFGEVAVESKLNFHKLQSIGYHVLQLVLTELMFEKESEYPFEEKNKLNNKKSIVDVMKKAGMDKYIGGNLDKNDEDVINSVAFAWIGATHSYISFGTAGKLIKKIFNL